MKKHFRIRDYSENEKAIIAIFNLSKWQSFNLVWWEHLSQVKGINERIILGNNKYKYFQQKDLSERYYYKKSKEFHELRLGQMTMEEDLNRFLELLRYVDYKKNEKAKIQRFLSGLPQSYRDIIEFVEPKTLDDTIQKAMHCYEQNKGRYKEHQSGRGKPKGKFDPKNKECKPPHYRNQPRNVQQGQQAQGGLKITIPTEGRTREPIQCWGCGENQMLQDCPHQQGNPKGLHNIEEAVTVEDMARATPRIYLPQVMLYRTMNPTMFPPMNGIKWVILL